MRTGFARYIVELKNFTEIVSRAPFYLDVLPTLTPFPCGYEPHNLISLNQMFHYIMVANVGKMAGDRVLTYSLWKTFHKMVHDFGVSQVDLPSPPIFVDGINSLTEVRGLFLSGMRGDSSNGLPRDIEKEFVIDLINTISEQLAMSSVNKVTLPSVDSIMEAIGKQKNVGRKYFVIGTSIIGNVVTELTKLTAEKGVEVVPMLGSGDYFDKARKYDYSPLRGGARTRTSVYCLLSAMQCF